MSVSIPVPRWPTWVPWAALVGWLGALAAATWLRVGSDDASFWRPFCAEVISTLASLLFALAGGAALISRWEHHRLLVETSHTTVLELNLVHGRVRRLIEEILSVLEPVIPLVAHATPDSLAWLLCSPVDENARALIGEAATAGARDPQRGPEERKHDEQIRRTLAQRDVPGPTDEAYMADRWWVAKLGARSLAKYDDNEESAIQLVVHGRHHWRQVMELVIDVGPRIAALQTPALATSRTLSKDARRLEAVCENAQGGALQPLANADSRSALNLNLAVHELWQALDLALVIAQDLAALRIEFARRLDQDDSPFGPVSELQRLDRTVALFRESAQISVASGLAWEWEQRLDKAADGANPGSPADGS